MNDDANLTQDDLAKLGYLPKDKVDSFFNETQKIIDDAMAQPRKFGVAKDEFELKQQMSKVLFGVDTSEDYNERGLVNPQYRPSAFEKPEDNKVLSLSSNELKENLRKKLYGEEDKNNE